VQNNYGFKVTVDRKRPKAEAFIKLNLPESQVQQFEVHGRKIGLIAGLDGVDLNKVEFEAGARKLTQYKAKKH
jgi:hypothetical protein